MANAARVNGFQDSEMSHHQVAPVGLVLFEGLVPGPGGAANPLKSLNALAQRLLTGTWDGKSAKQDLLC